MQKNFDDIDIERLTHSTKAAIACLIGLILTYLLGFSAGQWIIITIIVVMCAQLYVGSVLQKAYWRFLGTLGGCLFASLTLAILGDTRLAITIAVTSSLFIFSYFATSKDNLGYASTLGAVTTAIIMLGQKPTFAIAIERFFEINIGILIAATVSQFILPIHASAHLRRAQAKALGQLRDYYMTIMQTSANSQKDGYDPQTLEESIVKSLLKQRQLANESAAEPLNLSFDNATFIQSLYCEREILRAITFMHTALMMTKQTEKLFDQWPQAHIFNETIVQSLNTLTRAIQNDSETEEHIHSPSLLLLREDLQKNAEPHSREDLIYIDGFLFSAEVLTKSIAKLASLYGVKCRTM